MSDLKRVSQVLESRADRSPQPGLPGIQKRESTGSSRAVSFSLGPPGSRRGTQTSLRSRLRSYDESRVNLDLSTRITGGGVRKYSQEPNRATAGKGGAAKKYSVPASYRRYTAPSQPNSRLPSTSIGILQRYGHYDLSDYVGMLRYLRLNSAKRRKFLKRHRLPSATEFYPEGEAPPEDSGESAEEEKEEVFQVEEVRVKNRQVKKRNTQKV
ncbi:Hypp3678 [Branchiostoma lanceolatum]|uniref:Hypp3678 protein n=1 Tax=Branchiostoma lanceolatum TaxID=7740 RepID=A0A8K0ESG9_BRALA|nr:Hypp3678 [Branchiostoma lanceolatum]